MPRRILFTSQKGGVGKSTLARSTAVALAYAGRRVLLADFDVDQRTCMRWQAQRVARALEPKIEVAAFSKEKKLGRVEFDYQDIVIDTRDGAVPRGLVRVAQVVYANPDMTVFRLSSPRSAALKVRPSA